MSSRARPTPRPPEEDTVYGHRSLLVGGFACALLLYAEAAFSRAPSIPRPGGELLALDASGESRGCPLRHTDVRAEVTGSVARVEVTQTFGNPYDVPIEAVYVFPLPDRAAVDSMEIRTGGRIIRAVIRRREEAQKVYEAARKSGFLASLLEQERPNVFTQSVANILPGEEIRVRIRYFELLVFDSGTFSFVFPTVVGPRFIPGKATSWGRRGWSPDTTDVPDASRITPRVVPPEYRAGHDISLRVSIDAGAELEDVLSPTHRVDIEEQGPGRVLVRLRPEDRIPNKDFVLRHRIVSSVPRLIVLPHRTREAGYFLMLVLPETEPDFGDVLSKELVFVVDCSGSMSGFPIDLVKEAMSHSLRNLDSGDTFQIIRFSESAQSFAPAPVPASSENVRRGLEYVASLSANGGTILLEGVAAAVNLPVDPERLRIISFMTDGYIGNESQVLDYLSKNLGQARLFSFGVGSSVNRYLLDRMADLGRGSVEYLLQAKDAEAPIARFYERIRSPYLVDVHIDWGDLSVTDVYPGRLPDLFLGQPLVIFGRYLAPGDGVVRLSALQGGYPFQQDITVRLPERQERGEAIASLWARARIEDLSLRQVVDPHPDLVEAIVRVGLAHHLASPYTSFVAVEQRESVAGEPLLVEVPVETPLGVSYEAVFGSGMSFGVTEMWQSMGWSPSVAYLGLLSMMIVVLGAFLGRSATLRRGRNRSRSYARTARQLLEAGRTKQVVELTETEAANGCWLAQTFLARLGAAGRTEQRPAVSDRDFRRGLRLLRMISVTAPLLGLAGTAMAMVHVFHGMSSSPLEALTLLRPHLTEILTYLVAGFLVASVASGLGRWIVRRSEVMARETEKEASGLLGQIAEGD